jgi:Na+/H+ antiporter NhaD/arsenite permease-like protein
MSETLPWKRSALRQGGSTYANIIIGVLCSSVDNIPFTYAVLTMNPLMDLNQWLLITLTVGTGGSLLSIGSAAGVAVIGVRCDVCLSWRI